MLWLIVTILAYFLLALVSIGDKFLLAGPPNPKTYTFYVGILGVLAVVLIPFVNFFLPEINILLLSFLAGILQVFAILGLYLGLEYYEASRVIPALGGLLPLFTFGLIYFFSQGKQVLTGQSLGGFMLLLTGSVLITLKTKKTFQPAILKVAGISAFLFALSFLLSKYVYEAVPFWTGFIWMRLGGFLAALSLIGTKDVREEIFTSRHDFNKKSGLIFLVNQALGGTSFILQNWAIALAGMVFLPIINALQGVQYVFLFIFATILTKKAPEIFKEKISRLIIWQKSIAILLIVIGLFLIAKIF
jgi:drug/metabolite transporter (DMT)-like permease